MTQGDEWGTVIGRYTEAGVGAVAREMPWAWEWLRLHATDDQGLLEHPGMTDDVPESSLHPSVPCQELSAIRSCQKKVFRANVTDPGEMPPWSRQPGACHMHRQQGQGLA